MYPDSPPRRKPNDWLAVLLAGLIGLSMPGGPAAAEDAADTDTLDALFADEAAAPDQDDNRDESATAVITLPEETLPETAPAPRARRQIEEIVVTATKREASTRDLPISIDAFSDEELEAKGADSLESFLRFSPGVTVNQGLDQDSVFVAIRGITANSQGGFFNRPTGLFYDDVTLVNPSIRGPEPNMDPFDMAAVEVLKGPQGTLFGGSALAGAVRYVPRQPQIDAGALSGRVTAGIAEVAESGDMNSHAALAVNLGVSENAALRLAGSLRRYAGTMDDTYRALRDINSSGANQYRIIGRWQAAHALDIELTYLRREAFQDDGSRGDNDLGRTIDSRRLPDTSDSVIEIPRLELDWAFDAFDVVLSASRLRKQGLLDFDQTRTLSLHDTPAAAHQLVIPDVTQPAAELRMVSSRPTAAPPGWDWLLGDWDYTLGLFWQRSDQFLDLPIFVQPVGGIQQPELPLPVSTGDESPETLALRIYLDAIATEQAFYFDTTKHFGRFALNLGGRLFRQVTRGGSANQTQGGAEVSNGRATLKESGINPKLSLSWDWRDNVSLYGAATRGFRYGGINPVIEPDTPLTFQSDKLWNYELGLRTEWLNRQVLADLTVFYIDWQDVQVDQVSAGALNWAANVGEVRSQGIEAATQMLLPWNLSLNANAAYVDSRTTVEFESVDGTVPPGTRMPATPYLTASAQLGHQLNLGPWALDSAVSLTYAGESTNNLVATYQLPASTLTNLALSVSRLDWASEPRLGLNVNNLTNEEYIVSAQTNIGVGIESLRTWFNQPRTVSLNLSFRF